MNLIRRSLALSLFAFIISILFSTSTHATTAIIPTDKDLIVSSRFIVTGEVRSVVCAWDDTHQVAWTYVEVDCDRLLKGNLENRTIVLKELGGYFPDGGYEVVGAPYYQAGQRVLLYLNTSADGALHTAHSFVGSFSIETDIGSGEIIAKRNLNDEVRLLAPVDESTTTSIAPLREYLGKIRQTLNTEIALIAQYDAIHQTQPLTIRPLEYERKKREGINFSTDFVVTGTRWFEADSGQSVSYYLNPDRSPVAGGGSAEVTRGLTAWSAQSGAPIQLQLAGSTTSCGAVRDGANVISFGDCLGQLDPAIGCSGVVARTTVYWSLETTVIGGRSYNRLLEADIVFNRGMDCFLSTPSTLAEIACHEIGHSIGLGHSGDSNAIMWALARGRRDATLAADDITGVLAIYPQGSSGGGGGGGGGGGSNPNDARFVNQTVTSAMNPGQSYAVSITMRNSGTAIWDSSYKLTSQSSTDWGIRNVRLPNNISPGSDATFNFNVTAPSQPGLYNFQWIMNQDNVGVFGAATTNLTINVGSAGSGGGGSGGAVTIINLSLIDGFVGSHYKQSLSAKGGLAPYRWQFVNGDIPPGLSFSTNGVLEGTPTSAGTYTVIIQVYDFSGKIENSDTKRYTLNIFNPAGSGADAPLITRIKVKGIKKLFIFGKNFSATSLIVLNGAIVTPLSFEVDGETGILFFKGKLNLGSEGTNWVQVINGANRSSLFFF
ncbi:MAG: matrixin family metalloprotease [Acidobacteriota bacterium]